MRRSEYLLLAALSACAPEARVLQAPLSSGTVAWVWVVERDGQIIAASGADGENRISLPVEPGDRVTILEYSSPLEDLLIPYGKIEPSETSSARGFPAGGRTYSQIIEADRVLEWGESEPSDVLKMFRFAHPDLRTCLKMSACYSQESVDLLGARRCLSPCPTPPELQRPEPPVLPTAVCLQPWTPQAITSSVSVCLPQEIVCENPREHYFPSGRCIPIGTPCPALGEFADSLPPETIYVRSSAVGGDGSRAAPFSSIETALASTSSASVVIALAAEETPHEVGLTLDRNIRMVGACPEKSVLNGSILAAIGESRLENLRITAPNNAVEAYPAATLLLLDAEVEAEGIGVAAYGATTIQRVSIRGAAGAVVAGVGATRLHIAHSSLRAETSHVLAIESGSEGTFVLEWIELQGAGLHSGLHVNAGATGVISGLKISDVYTGILLSAGIVTATFLEIEDVVDGIVVSIFGTIFAHHLWIEDAGAVSVRNNGSAALVQALIRGGGDEAVIAAESGQTQLRDFVVQENRARHPVNLNHRSLTELERVFILDSLHGGLVVRDESRVLARDLTIEYREEHLRDGFSAFHTAASSASVVTGQKIRIINSANHGIEASFSGRLVLDDLSIERSQNRTLDLSNSVEADLLRVQLIDGEGDDISVSERVQLKADHIKVAGRGRDTFGPRKSIDATGRSIAELKNFVLEEGKAIGVSLGELGVVSLSHGRVGLHPIDFQISEEREPELPMMLEKVLVEGAAISP